MFKSRCNVEVCRRSFDRGGPCACLSFSPFPRLRALYASLSPVSHALTSLCRGERFNSRSSVFQFYCYSIWTIRARFYFAIFSVLLLFNLDYPCSFLLRNCLVNLCFIQFVAREDVMASFYATESMAYAMVLHTTS